MKRIITMALALTTLAACSSPTAVSPTAVSGQKAPTGVNAQKDPTDFTDLHVLADAFLKQFNTIGQAKKVDMVATSSICNLTAHTVQTAAHRYDCTVQVNDDPNVPGSVVNNGDMIVAGVTVAAGGKSWKLTTGDFNRVSP